VPGCQVTFVRVAHPPMQKPRSAWAVNGEETRQSHKTAGTVGEDGRTPNTTAKPPRARRQTRRRMTGDDPRFSALFIRSRNLHFFPSSSCPWSPSWAIRFLSTKDTEGKKEGRGRGQSILFLLRVFLRATAPSWLYWGWGNLSSPHPRRHTTDMSFQGGTPP
jgi:hypothetical protein